MQKAPSHDDLGPAVLPVDLNVIHGGGDNRETPAPALPARRAPLAVVANRDRDVAVISPRVQFAHASLTAIVTSATSASPPPRSTSHRRRMSRTCANVLGSAGKRR